MWLQSVRDHDYKMAGWWEEEEEQSSHPHQHVMEDGGRKLSMRGQHVTIHKGRFTEPSYRFIARKMA